MSIYAIAVFLHIVGALGLFAAMGLEWASLGNLRRAASSAQLREWFRLLRTAQLVAGPAGLAILVTGIYLSTRWGQQPWIGLGLLGLVLIGVLGGTLTRRRIAAIRKVVSGDDDRVPDSVRRRLDDPVLRLSFRLRLAVALGIVFLMSVKPGGAVALTAIGVALASGLIVGLPAWRSARYRAPVTSQPIGS